MVFSGGPVVAKLFVSGRPKKGSSNRSRETERERAQTKGLKREKDCQKSSKDSSMKITYMYSSIDIYRYMVYTAREER